MKTSEVLSDFAPALAKAQGVLEGAKKDSSNPFFKSSYADLESVWTACRKALTSNGFSVIQGTSSDAEGVTVTTRLLHASGQWVEDSLRMIPKDASGRTWPFCLT